MTTILEFALCEQGTGSWSRSPLWSAYRTENRPNDAAFLVGYARLKVERSNLVVCCCQSSISICLLMPLSRLFFLQVFQPMYSISGCFRLNTSDLLKET